MSPSASGMPHACTAFSGFLFIPTHSWHWQFPWLQATLPPATPARLACDSASQSCPQTYLFWPLPLNQRNSKVPGLHCFSVLFLTRILLCILAWSIFIWACVTMTSSITAGTNIFITLAIYKHLVYTYSWVDRWMNQWAWVSLGHWNLRIHWAANTKEQKRPFPFS